MSDLISRQTAIDAIRASASKYTGFMEMEMYTDDDAVEAINGVPSTEPVRHGAWISQTLISISNGTYMMHQCSECGDLTINRYKYCPNCGARMDGND